MTPATAGQARCTTRGCPTRFRAGDDRPCPMHAEDSTSLLARMTAIGAVLEAAPGYTMSDLDGGDESRPAPGPS